MRTTFSFLASSLVLASLAFAAGCGSSGGSNGPSAAEAMQSCVSVCQKTNSCYGGTTDCNASCTPSSTSGSNTATNPNCNYSAYSSAENTCIAGSCSDFLGCLAQAASSSNCGSTTGSTGSTGASTGSTGTSSGGTTGVTGVGSTGSSTGGTGSSTGSTGSGATGTTSGSTTGTSTGISGSSIFGDGGTLSCSACQNAPACCEAIATLEGADAGSCAALSMSTCLAASATDQQSIALECALIVAAGSGSSSSCQ